MHGALWFIALQKSPTQISSLQNLRGAEISRSAAAAAPLSKLEGADILQEFVKNVKALLLLFTYLLDNAAGVNEDPVADGDLYEARPGCHRIPVKIDGCGSAFRVNRYYRP